MSWQREVDGIEERRRRAQAHGGAEAVARHRERGRLPIRERVAHLCDADSFAEQGSVAGSGELADDGSLLDFTPANYVLGTARIDGRPVVVGGEDFTLKGGSPSPAGLRKSIHAEDLALARRFPLVRLLEGGGGSVVGSAGRGRPAPPPPPREPHRFLSIARCMGEVPVASIALGAVAGFPAARLVASHFAVMTRSTAQVLVAGPAVVERATGETLSKEELGGARVHARSGAVDNVAEDEQAAFEQVRRFLSYLPSNVDEAAPIRDCDDPADRCEAELLELVPRDRRKIYDMRALLRMVVDLGSLFELTPGYGRSQITALARLGGRPVGVLANDTRFYAGAMDAEGAQKYRRFVDLCDTFHLPIVSFVDEPGFMIGSQAEKAGTIRYGAAALFAVMQSSVPWASVIVRKTYGVAAAAHFGPEAFVLAWPSAEGGALPIEGGVAVAFRREIAAAPDPEARRRELEESLARGRSAFPRADSFSAHDLIDPRETRPALIDWCEGMAAALASHVGRRAYTVRP